MTRHKHVGILLAVLVVGFSATTAVMQATQTSAKALSQTPQPTSSSAPSSANAPATTYTIEQVAAHATASSCWSAVNGYVYDLTPWISQHPGGEQNILNICGTDGSDAFNAQHGGQRRPANELKGFEIGKLTR